MSGKLMKPALASGVSRQSTSPRDKYQQTASTSSSAPETSIVSLLEILVVLGLSLALGTMCRILRYPTQQDRPEARTDQYCDLVSRCLSIIHALQSDATLPLPAKTLLHALSFALDKLNLISPTSNLDKASVPPGGSGLRAVAATDSMSNRFNDATATQNLRSTRLGDPCPKLDVSDSVEESDDGAKNVKLSKAARRRRNRKARLAPYLKPVSQTMDPPAS